MFVIMLTRESIRLIARISLFSYSFYSSLCCLPFGSLSNYLCIIIQCLNRCVLLLVPSCFASENSIGYIRLRGRLMIRLEVRITFAERTCSSKLVIGLYIFPILQFPLGKSSLTSQICAGHCEIFLAFLSCVRILSPNFQDSF